MMERDGADCGAGKRNREDEEGGRGGTRRNGSHVVKALEGWWSGEERETLLNLSLSLSL